MKGGAADQLIERLRGRTARIGVVGLGYVGLPVALSFVEAGFEVVAMDVDKARVDALKDKESYLKEIPAHRVAAAVDSGRLVPADDYDGLRDADVILIAVPTPLLEGTPDLSLVLAAGDGIATVLEPGNLVILESTSYPGTTEELLRPVLEERGLQAGTDFLLAFSPERIDPGNETFGFESIPKVVGGLDEASTRAATALYETVCPRVVPVSGTREAELSKLIENTFRHVNIALVNELAVYARELGIDIWESIDAAATKPFGFMPFYPGAGWGGHCIPLDPAYLSWRVKQQRSHEVRFVELAQQVNEEMPRYIAERVTLLLNDQAKPIKGAKICGIGVAYKPGVEDTRESPALKVLSILAERGADVSFHDPLVEETTVNHLATRSVELSPGLLESQDLAIVFIPQTGIDWTALVQNAPLVFDCCNALPREPNVTRL
jgi:UDP-N-acetyl-D-glucosamine dehydrogenase